MTIVQLILRELLQNQIEYNNHILKSFLSSSCFLIFFSIFSISSGSSNGVFAFYYAGCLFLSISLSEFILLTKVNFIYSGN